MSEIITYSDQKPQGTFAQIKLDEGKRILVSLTQAEIAVFKLILGGNIPAEKVWQHDIMNFVLKVDSKKEYKNKTPLEAAVDVVLGCKSVDDIAPKLNELIK
ncbi:hypothetical protein ISS21_02865 [Patescibacteria group bacterium]|nr:hypothetical protein [Patescibacteria group bacterium]